MSTREALLSAITNTAPPQEEVPVPELPNVGTVVIRGLTSDERDEYERDSLEEKAIKLNGRREIRQVVKYDAMRARLIQMCWVSPAGERMFTKDDLPALGRLRADVADRLYDVAARLSGLGKKDLEDLKGN